MDQITLHPPAYNQIRQLLASRIAILDGTMGAIIQQLTFGEADYRGGTSSPPTPAT